MAAGLGVLTGVLVRRTVAAEGHAAVLAGPKMNPLGADLYAFFAFASARKANRFNGLKMRATGKHLGIYSRKT
jgi:hypothetical protein